MTNTEIPKNKRKKTMAILAGGLVLGLGATATIAAWTDTEWVFGGNAGGDGPGIGTSTFEVAQNVTAPFDAAGFTQDEENPGQALLFGLDALSLTPGDSIYAPVALTTVEDSLGGTVLLNGAVAADETDFDPDTLSFDPEGVLAGALDLRVAVVEGAAPTCDATAFDAPAAIIVDGALDAGATLDQDLDADGGNVFHYCFEITLPAAEDFPDDFDLDTLQGRSVAPAWEFEAVSVVAAP